MAGSAGTGHSGPCPVWPWISPRWMLQLLWANLFQRLTLLWIKTKNLSSHVIFLYFSLCPLPLVPSLLTAESSQALPSFPIRYLYAQITFPSEPFLLKAKQRLSDLGGLLLRSLQRVHVCAGGPEPGTALGRSCICAEQRGRLTFLKGLPNTTWVLLLQGFTAVSWSTCPPGPPGSVLPSCFPTCLINMWLFLPKAQDLAFPSSS